VKDEPNSDSKEGHNAVSPFFPPSYSMS
jgi:hypothetical protein